MVRERNSEGGRDGGADFRFLLQICSVKPVGYNSISSPFPLNEKFETYNSISSLLGFPLYSSPGGSFSPYDSISHDLPLQHPNFAFVNCQRKTKYEEIIGDCVGFGHEGYQQLVPPYRTSNARAGSDQSCLKRGIGETKRMTLITAIPHRPSSNLDHKKGAT
ncbi:uncharacterized protein LOC126612375 isoform X2 [Malus sylvestris]|uniref:uncharacterized protein n=1 Tax=Malus domestica TaxID=3750 RepID=UPI0010AA7A55|nr:uncharacterized protein LOC103444777 [Malus domestica]XP_028950325.1 uncharacterized protein LOC103444777 [Malus domestica]XP_050136747.1 uncharacterized protein LOC126612375 isoform X2 [Malus sylvestris]